MKTLVRAPRLLTSVTLALFMLTMARPASAAGPAASAAVPAGSATTGPLTPPVAALRANGMPGSGVHALGYAPNLAAALAAPAVNAAILPAALPAAVDLSQYNPPVGDQKSVNSCTSWATGYYLRGWYAKRDGYYPSGGAGGSYAPMYLYSQLVHGQNIGTSFKDNLNILQQQGIDTRADYTQGDYDYTDLPTASETANATHIKLASYSDVGNGGGTSLQNWIETTLASGNPVALGIPIYPEFDHASATNPLVGVPLPGETSRGGHAVFASKYDANGLWIENSWGTSFGLNGWAELSWSFVNQYASEAVSEAPLSPGSTVPPVIGQLSSPAASTVRAAGFAVTLVSAADRTCNYIGRVMGESPTAGSWAVNGSTVKLTIGSRPPTPCP